MGDVAWTFALYMDVLAVAPALHVPQDGGRRRAEHRPLRLLPRLRPRPPAPLLGLLVPRALRALARRLHRRLRDPLAGGRRRAHGRLLLLLREEPAQGRAHGPPQRR